MAPPTMSNGRPPMTEQARLSRIGELLSRAVVRKCRKDELESIRHRQPNLTEATDPVLTFIAQVGEVSPNDIQAQFSISRSTASRRLGALVATGLLEKSGKTRRTRYRLSN